MTLDVKFEEQDQTFNTNFGEIQTVSDGGFERGYNEGYAQGEVEGYDKGKTDGRVEGEQNGYNTALSKLTTLEVTENGEYTPSDDNIGFDKVTVNIGGEEKSKLVQYLDGTLTEITANDLKGITEFNSYAFAYSSITSIEIPNSVTMLTRGLFYLSSLQHIILHDNIRTIGDSVFYYCQKITNIEMPDSVKFLGNSVFSDCTKLVSVKLSNKLTSISGRMFYGCDSLTSITIPSSVTSIERYAFYSCDSLTSITIPSSVTSIDQNALHIGWVTNKAIITFLGTVPPTINSNSLNSNLLNKIIVPKGCGDVYKSATNWSAYADYIEEATE